MEWITQTEAAQRLQVPRQKITKLISRGIIKKRKKDKKIEFESVKKIFSENKILNKNHKSDYDDFAEARLAYETYRAKLAELEYLEKSRAVLPIQDYIEFSTDIIKTVTNKFMGIGAKLAPELLMRENIKEIKKIIDEPILEALKELSRLKNVKSINKK